MMKYTAMLLALVMAAGAAQAVSFETLPTPAPGDLTYIVKHDDPETARGPGFTHVNINSDGTYLNLQYHPADVNNSWSINVNNNADGDYQVGLIGWADMFAQMPLLTSSSQIGSAYLKFNQRGPNGGEVLVVDRVTTEWMFYAAGGNETQVSGQYIVPGADPWGWGPEGNQIFSSADYTTVNEATFTIARYQTNLANYIDVTEIVKDMFNDGNNGFVIRLLTPVGADPWFQADERALTEMGSDGFGTRPSLYITIPEPATLCLLAIGGIGALLRRRR